jgi:lysylphosphatidylglycerol synthetase-like protein (DUF2156 family)
MMNRQPSIADDGLKDLRIHIPHSEAELLRRYGSHTLAFFGLASKNRHFLAPGGAGLVNYQLTRKVAVTLGDPVCAPEACEQIIRSFLDFCTLQRWRVAFYQASAGHLAIYRALKLPAFKLGEEAILYPQTFTLRGSALANVRTSCRRAEREGVCIEFHVGVPPPEVIQHLKHISRVWLDGKAGKQVVERSFCLSRIDELAESAEMAEMIAALSTPANVLSLPAPRLVTAVAKTSTGRPCAFVTFTPVYGCLTREASMSRRPSEMPGTNPLLQRHCVSTASPSAALQEEGWGWALDLMRRIPDTPPGVMDLLLVRAIERFRSCKAQRLSLGLAALADTRQEMSAAGKRLASFASRLGLVEPSQTLFNFKEKFHPCWESRYLVANTTLGLPKVAGALYHLRNSSGDGRD